MKTNFISMDYEELNKSYPDVSKHEDIHEGQKYMVFPEDAVFDQSLSINSLKNHDGIIVMGDLKVNGNVDNSEGDYGATLIVCKDTYADNLIAGGAIIDLMGNAYIKYLSLAHYNHGILRVGKIHCPLLIDNDHATGIKDDTALDTEFNTYYHGALESNQFTMEDLGVIFPDKTWIEIDTDDNDDMDEAGFNCYFSTDEFMKLELTNSNNITNIIQHVKNSIVRQKQLEDSYFNQGMANTEQMYRYLLRKIDIPLYNFAPIPKNSNIKLVKGDYEIKSDLILDKDSFSPENIYMLFIDGDLNVEGSIYNSFEKEGVVLFVTGNVYCVNFLISTSEVFINNCLMVDNILLCGLPEEIEIDSGPSLKVKEIKSASLAIIESGYELKNRLGSKLKNKIFTMEENRKKDHFLISDLEKILDEKFWSKEDEYINEEVFWKTVIQNKSVLKPNHEDIVAKIIDKKKKKIDPAKQKIIDIIECIRVFLDKNDIEYYQSENYLEIVQSEIRYEMRYEPVDNTDPTMNYKLSLGTYPYRKYDPKKELKKYKSDLIYYLEKYLLNQVRLDYLKKDNKTIGDILQVFENEKWSEALGNPEYYLYLASESTSVESVMNQFSIDGNEITNLLDNIKKY